jgi:putative PIN family toxin of toxin-antitoxin system
LAQPRLILDSNVYLNYLLSPNPSATAVAFALDAAAAGEVRLLLPEDVIAELIVVIAERPHLRKRVSLAQLDALLDRIFEFATLLPVFEDEPPSVVRDEKDDYLVALAVLHAADFLVTRDRDLLSLHNVLGIQVIDPAGLIAMLRTSQE